VEIFSFSLVQLFTVMLSPRGQAVLEAKILSSASKICPQLWTRPRAILSSTCPRTFYFGLVKMCVMLELAMTLACMQCMLNVVTRTMIDDDDDKRL